MAVAALYAIIARSMVSSAMLGDDLASLWDWSLIQIVLDSSEGRAGAVRATGLVGIAVFSFGTFATRVVGVPCALLVAGSFALTGHAGSVGTGDLPRILVAVHVLAVSLWIGALVPLYKVASSAEFSRAGAILKRFGDMARIVVAALVTAGLVLLWLLLGSLEAIFTSDYGRLVLVKLAFVAGLLTLAAVNRLRLTPGLMAGDRSVVPRLRWSIGAEIMLAGAILVVTAIFTTVIGPPGTAGS
jgi:putative copper export protein